MSEFEPSRYLTQLQGKDYLEVKWRLVWLRAVHPDAVIRTQLERYDANEAVVHAHIVILGGGEADGLGSETKQDFRDYLEKAETKAIGRALAALGFGTQFCEDHTFDPNQSGKVVDSPVSFGASRDTSAFVGRQNASEAASHDAQPQATGARVPGGATVRQVNYINVLAKDAGMDDIELHELIKGETDKDSRNDLTGDDASKIIGKLQPLTNNPRN